MLMDTSYRNTNAYKYAQRVVDGEIIAGKYIRKQCEIFLDDLERQHTDSSFQWEFDVNTYEFIIGFQNLFKFADGVLAGQPMKLADFQEWILANMFCWKHREHSYIRYSKAFIQIARTNVSKVSQCY